VISARITSSPPRLRSSRAGARAFGIAIDAQDELRQVVAADGEAVEPRGERLARTTFDGTSHMT